MTMVRRALLGLVALCMLAAPTAAQAAPVYDYATTADGTDIAVSVWFPPGYTPGSTWPALFEMDGYGGARNVNDTQFAGKTKDFVVVYASVRGSGCSGGRFDLFGPVNAADGHDVIERWIVKQPWSNGRVGITGHSYSGLTGLAVAETAPPHVRAVAVSGLMDDLYRGLLNPGGVQNFGFPVVWAGAARPALEAQANAGAQATDERCRANFLEHEGSDYVASPELFLATYGNTQATEDSFEIARGLMRHIAKVDKPTQIGHQWQDEQTGPRGGPILWEHLRAGLPKRLILSNGRHNPNDPTGTKDDWLRCWVIHDGKTCGSVSDPRKRVLFFFDSRRTSTAPGQQRRQPYVTSDFPAPETDWQRIPLAARSYVALPGDYHVTLNTGLVFAENTGTGQATFGQDDPSPTMARWTIPFAKDTVIGGPIAMTFWATLTAPDSDFWVDVLDHDPRTGELRYLQRGVLKASYRAVDQTRSDRVASGPRKGEVWRPYHPYTNPQNVPIGEPQRYELEIYPLGHVFRPGHELVLQLHTPPPNDPLSIGTFTPTDVPASVQVLDDPEHRSSILLPVLPRLPGNWAHVPCGTTAGELCLVDSDGTIDDATAPPQTCASRRVITIRLPKNLRRATVRLEGRRVTVRRRAGRLTARIDLRGRDRGTVTVAIQGTTKKGRTVRRHRRFRVCTPRPH